MENTQESESRHIASKSDERSFWIMVILAAQNAFNDKASQFFLIPLGGWLIFQAGGSDSNLAYVLGALIVAPFIFLSPFAGWLSDRYSKTWVMRGGMLLQLAVLALIVLSVSLHNLNLGVIGFFLLAVQSTLLSPAKKGLVKELVGSERLGFASGLLEMASVLAICAGQIVSGFWFDSRLSISGDGWQAAEQPLLILTLCAIPAVILSWTMKVVPSPSKRQFKLPILWEHFGQLRDVFTDRRLKWSASGIAFFWFFGGFINMAAIKAGETLSGGAEGFGTEMAWFIAAASGGIILGGLLGSIGCKRHIELGLVPIGGIIMVLGCIFMACCNLESYWFKCWMVLAGAGGAIFLVPLNAYLQDVCDPEKRGRILAGVNLLDCLAGALAVFLQYVLNAFGMTITSQFLILAALSLLVTCYSTKLLPQHFVRFTILSLFRIIYRQKIMFAERMPKEGGVLIVPNHVSYIDAFMITAASPRPVRFLMYDGYFKKNGLMKQFIKLFNTVPISNNRAKEAIQVAADAVAEGSVVCIFPEGQLTRSGGLNEIKRGFEMIARKAKCPVMPVYMDGMWGSIFSFERGKLFKKVPYKVPYGVTVAWGEPLRNKEVSASSVRSQLHTLAWEAFTMRDSLIRPAKTLKKVIRQVGGSTETLQTLHHQVLQLDEGAQRSLLANALQVAESPAFYKRQTIIVDADCKAASLFAIALAQVQKLRVILADENTSEDLLRKWSNSRNIAAYIGGDYLWQLVDGAELSDGSFFHTEGHLAPDAKVPCYPMGMHEGRILAISTHHPDAITPTNQFQAGWKEGSLGRLLPAYRYEITNEGRIALHAITEKNAITLPLRMDSEGFLFPTKDAETLV